MRAISEIYADDEEDIQQSEEDYQKNRNQYQGGRNTASSDVFLKPPRRVV